MTDKGKGNLAFPVADCHPAELLWASSCSAAITDPGFVVRLSSQNFNRRPMMAKL
jgi:hypothetical protein